MISNTGSIVRCALCVAACLTAQSGYAQYSPLRLLVTADAIVPLYSADPAEGATHVVFPGEPLTLRVRIDNTGDASADYISPDAPGFHIAVSRPDGQLVDVPVEIAGDPQRVHAAFSAPERWRDLIRLAPEEAVEWLVRPDISKLAPGVYRFRVVLTGTDGAGVAVLPQVTRQDIELRGVTPDTELDYFFRRGFRLGYSADAERQMRAVLALYPDSSLVHATLGTILENQGELDAAARSYQQAVDLLERRADVVFLERRPQRAAMALEAWREAVLRTRVRR